MNLKRILIGESEKSRILSLHENLKTESSKLLMEQDSETTTKYFEEQKKKYSNFPDGKVVPVEGGFAYQTNNGIFLYPNGTAYNSQGVKSTENWTDEPYVAVTTATGQATTATGQATTATGQATTATGQATTATGQATTATGQATTATGQSTIKPVSFESLPTDKDLRQSSKSEEKSKRSDAKQQLKNTQKRINDCTEAINNYIKYNLGSKPDTDKTKQQYVNYLKTNCSGIDEIDLTIVGL
jgi:hypothetical protein